MGRKLPVSLEFIDENGGCNAQTGKSREEKPHEEEANSYEEVFATEKFAAS